MGCETHHSNYMIIRISNEHVARGIKGNTAIWEIQTAAYICFNGAANDFHDFVVPVTCKEHGPERIKGYAGREEVICRGRPIFSEL